MTDTRKKTVANAFAAYKSKDYEQALDIYLSLANSMKSRSFDANIQLCETLLQWASPRTERAKQSQSVKTEPNRTFHSRDNKLETSLDNGPELTKSLTHSRRKNMTQVVHYLREIGRSDLELEMYRTELKLLEDQSIRRATYWAAMRIFDLKTAAECVRWLENNGNKNKTSLEWIERAKQGPVEAIRLTNQLENPCKTPIFPLNPDRVVYVMHNTLPYSSGGYATRGHGLAVGLREAGIDVHCLSRPGYPGDLLDEIDEAKNQTKRSKIDIIDEIPYHRIFSPFRRGMPVVQYMEIAAKKIEAVLRELRPACVLAASNHVTALPSCLAARAIGIPFVYEVRGFWEVTRLSREPEFVNTTGYKLQRFYEAETSSKADMVLTLTTPMKEELIKRGVRDIQIKLAPNSCDPERFIPRPRDVDLANRYKIEPDIPVIGYIGTFVQYEGLDHLVLACGYLKQKGIKFRLLLVGNENASGTGCGQITEEILRIAQETGLDQWLIMPGRISHNEVESHYSLIDVAPFPRKPQPVTEMVSPMKPLEALAMEKAVVVSSVRALVEMIKHDETGLVFEKGNIMNLVGTLERLLQDRSLRERLGKAGRRWVVNDRSWHKTAQSVASVLRGLMK